MVQMDKQHAKKTRGGARAKGGKDASEKAKEMDRGTTKRETIRPNEQAPTGAQGQEQEQEQQREGRPGQPPHQQPHLKG